MISILDLFRIGIGPSSSHTVGPMRIARRFVGDLGRSQLLGQVARIEVALQGSLALTGIGHGSVDAVILGLLGQRPSRVDPDAVPSILGDVAERGRLQLPDGPDIAFEKARDIRLDTHIIPELHPNGMVLRAYDGGRRCLLEESFYSTGGGFFASEKQLRAPVPNDGIAAASKGKYRYGSAADLLDLCASTGLTIDQIVSENEDEFRPRQATWEGIDNIVAAMLGCIDRGLKTEGILPGGLNVRRRAPEVYGRLTNGIGANEAERLLDWLNVFALAVNEENAAGSRVVTAPTNGAAGIVPAVLKYYCCNEGQSAEVARRFLLTAGGIALLYKMRASISGAEMGCQGEVGVACSIAAAGLAAIWGGTPVQVASAAEIGMEHNLGLTCDPVGGLVQIPCIERNALGAVKAVNAARLALHSEERPKVSLDQVIETMRQTGIDMSSRYKETSQGGLAVNVIAC
ncbi:MAG: L-serine ammonia-lyase [Sphingomonadaceae bacterium]|nr:L-serine ammonia-lyase [Sphingomonadaceae bacterium]